MKEINFDKMFKSLIIGMNISGCQPHLKRNKFWLTRVLIFYGCYSTYLYFLINCIINYDLENNDYFNAFRNGVPVSIFFAMSFIYAMLLRHQKTVARMFDLIKNDYVKARNMNERCNRIVNEYADKSLTMLNRCFISIMSVVVFIIRTIILSIISKIEGDFKLIPFYDMHYPSIIENNKDNIFVFIATYIGEMYYTYSSILIYFCVIPVGPLCMLHACGQLELIKTKFENIFLEDAVNERLIDIIKHLQHVYGLVEDINICFSWTYELEMKNTTILLPLISIAIIKTINQGKFPIEFISVMASSIMLITYICYYSDFLMEKSEEVRQAAYSCGWERMYVSSTRKTLLIVMIRAFKPVAIRSIFTTVCLDTLGDVFRQSYTIFNLLTAIT